MLCQQDIWLSRITYQVSTPWVSQFSFAQNGALIGSFVASMRIRTLLGWGLKAIQFSATRFTRIGERYDIEWLTYNPLLFVYFLGRSLADAPGVISTLEGLFPEARAFLDVGAGSGGFAAQLRRHGHAVQACERDRTGRRLTRLQRVTSTPFDLASADPAPGISGRFDLAYSFEVAEHLTPELGRRLVEFIASRADTVVFSAAQPGQGGMGHINEQPSAYWVQLFDTEGMQLDEPATDRLRAGFRSRPEVASWFALNALVLRSR